MWAQQNPTNYVTLQTQKLRCQSHLFPEVFPLSMACIRALYGFLGSQKDHLLKDPMIYYMFCTGEGFLCGSVREEYGLRPLKLLANMTNKCDFLYSHFFANRSYLFGFGNPESAIFQWQKIQPCLSNDSRLTVLTVIVVRRVPRVFHEHEVLSCENCQRKPASIFRGLNWLIKGMGQEMWKLVSIFPSADTT